MFTSLAEYRLELRHDNADSRLLKYAEQYRLLTGKEIKYLKDRLDNIAKLPEIFSSLKIKMKNLNELYEANSIGPSSEGTDIYRLLKRPDTNINMMLNSGLLDKIKDKFSYYELKQAETLIKYEGYIKRQTVMIGRFEKNEKIKLPQDIDYSKFKGLKKEAVEKLNRIKPVSVGQAGRIAGISPADISVILINLKTKGLI